MNSNHYYPCALMIAAILVLLSTSCSSLFNFGPSVSELTTTTGFDAGYHPIDNINSFYIDSPKICCSAKVSNAHCNTVVQARWIQDNGGGNKEANSTIYTDAVVCDNDCYVGFTLFPPPVGFVSGKYGIEISIEGKTQAAGLFYIQKDEAGSLPVINSFSSDASGIVAGQSAMLNWKVSTATRAYIEPSPGKVVLEGKQAITPAVDTTYTLWALNRSGISSSRITVKVTEPVIGQADLVVTECWNTGNILFYNIKNVGTRSSNPCESYLYLNDHLESKDYVAPLESGEERIESFGAYHFSLKFTSMIGASPAEGTTDAINVRVYVNGNSACSESNYINNCMEHNFGTLLNLNLNRYSNIARWQSSSGTMAWPIVRDNSGWAAIGTAQLDKEGSYPNAILMTPPLNTNSWIQGSFGLPGSSPGGLQPITVPHKCKLIAKVALTGDVHSSANVKFILGTVQDNNTSYYPPVIVKAKGTLMKYEVDLGQLAGKQAYFILRVESGEPLQQGSAVWIDPTLVQER